MTGPRLSWSCGITGVVYFETDWRAWAGLFNGEGHCEMRATRSQLAFSALVVEVDCGWAEARVGARWGAGCA